MVQYLRGFGFSVETIQHIKALCIRQVPEDVLRIVRRKENLVQPRDRKPNFLTNVAAELITCKNHLSLIYTEQGQLYVHHLNTVLADETRTAQLSPFLNYVSISLSSIYIKFLLEAGISVIQSLDIFPKELVQLVTDLRAGIVSDVSLIYAHDQVVLSSLYYTDPMDFARDCLRLATTTQYKRLELTYEPQPGGGKLLEVGSSPEVGIEKGSKRGAKRDAI